MKNKLAIYFSLLMMMLVVSSCFKDDDGTSNPYAYIKSFGIGDITSSYYDVTAAGKDTMVVVTISGSAYPFTIDQASGNIYNNDSLPYATNVTKVTMKMTVEGVATMYVPESNSYEYFTTEDSLDFTNPRLFRITSLDGTYSKDYTISVNAHQVQPDSMAWNKVSAVSGLVPEKAIEFNNRMYVFGNSAGNVPAFVSTALGADVAWSDMENVSGFSSDVDFSTLHLFNDTLYVLSNGDLYASADAVAWQPVLQGNELIAIVGASDIDGYLWLANDEKIYRSVDGASIEEIGSLPAGFPLYGVSTVSYALSHNDDIIRYMLVGYSDKEQNGAPKVWSKLSTEKGWVEYVNTNNTYSCPALENLSVLRYDNNLYAFGGAGKAEGDEVAAFNSFYISRDNGIVWKAPLGFYQRLPKELKGEDVLFVATVDSDNYMWIITPDESFGAWRGIINRLGFKK